MASTFNEEKISKCNIVLLDVEGTTTSITFVKDILFPYAIDKASVFLNDEWDVEGVQEAVEGMRLQADKDILSKVEGAVPIPEKDSSKADQIKGVVDNLKWLISIDNKGTFMKKLSGLIWEKGYLCGDIKGHVYSDVSPALELWQNMGKKIYVYSSGSVHAQKLLMKHSELGDLSPRFTGNFDTAVGQKQEMESYKNILKNIECQPDEAIFFTDIVKEAEAATAAGLYVCLVIREGNAPLSEEDESKFHKIKSLGEIKFTSSSKRKQEEEEMRPCKVAKTEDTDKTDSIPEKKEVIEQMEVEDTKANAETKKSQETEESKPIETEADRDEKKTDGDKDSSDKEKVPESMETEDVKKSEKVAEESKKEIVDAAIAETKSTVTEENIVEPKEETNINIEIDVKKEPEVGKMETKSVEEEKSKSKDSEDNKITQDQDIADDRQTEESVKPVESVVDEDVTTVPANVDENSKSSLDNINIDIAVDADEEEKITDLLGAGEALDKECDDILSKVDQVTNKDLVVKPFIEKEIVNKDLNLDDAMEVIGESVSSEDQSIEKNTKLTENVSDKHETNGKSEESCDADVKESSVNTKQDSEINKEVVEKPAKEVTDEVVSQKENDEKPNTENSHKEETNTNGDSNERLENGSKSEEVEVNGKEVTGNGVEQNGSNNETKKETNGANGNSNDEVVKDKETIDIKTKKVNTTEDANTEQVSIQTAET